MSSILLVLETIDVWLLVATIAVLQFVQDWTGISQKLIERVLIGAYAGLYFASTMHESSAWWKAFNVVFLVIILASLWAGHRKPRQARMTALVTGHNNNGRPSLLVLQMLFLPLILFPPVTRCDLCTVGANVTLVVLLYVLAIPQGGEPGKRIRQAIKKFVDTSGREFIPEAA